MLITPALRRRTLASLAVGQILASAAVTAGITVSVLVAEDMLGDDTWAGVVAAFFTVGAASSSFLLARYMSRRGRRPGLRLGYLIGLVGAVIAFVGVEVDVLLVFLIGSMLFGAAQASTLQARFAAADLAEPHQRSLYISTLVWTGAIGSVAGPLLVGRAKSLGVDRGFEELAGPYGVSVVLLALAAVAVTVLLHPDPLVVSGGLGGASAKFPPLTESVRLIWSGSATRLALIAMTVSQAVMVAVMTMTPSHMKEHGHDVDLVGQIFSIHVAGMFLFSPAVGWATDRMGRRPAIMLGSAILIAATALTALASGRTGFLGPGLFLLGLGWNFGLIAGSALLTESVDDTNRVGVQGSADMLMSICGGIGGLSSGIVKSMVGFHVLSIIGLAAAFSVLAAVTLDRHRNDAAVVAAD
jgi:MFS family permease